MNLGFNNLPILKSFKDLKKGYMVYSNKYGLGSIESLYGNNEVIVNFHNLRKRISVEEGDICNIPAEMLIKRTYKVEVNVNGINMGFKEFKSRNRLEKKRIALENKIIAFNKKKEKA